MVTVYYETKHKGARFSMSAAWNEARGWYRFVLIWTPAPAAKNLRPIVTRYNNSEAATFAACFRAADYSCAF